MAEALKCPHCGGHGISWDDICHLCEGKGRLTPEELAARQRLDPLSICAVVVMFLFILWLVLR